MNDGSNDFMNKVLVSVIMVLYAYAMIQVGMELLSWVILVKEIMTTYKEK